MKHIRLVLAFVVALAAIASAQPLTHTVQAGDTLWKLKGAQWETLREMNPWLGYRIRVQDQDTVIVTIYPGEVIHLTPEIKAAIEKPAPSIEPEKTVQIVQPAPPQKAEGSGFPAWLWPIIGLGLLALLCYWLLSRYRRQHDLARQEAFRQAEQQRETERLRAENEARRERERQMQLDPVTSGPAMVPGGIPATDTGRLTNFFDQQAVTGFAERHPNQDRNLIRVTRIGAIQEGTITGEGNVRYLDGTWRPRRIETPLRAYQARYRFPDGTEENLQCLQACMNPVAYGGEVFRGFTFTPSQDAVPVPEPPTPTPQPVPHPAIAVAPTRAAANEQGHSTITTPSGEVISIAHANFVMNEDGSVKVEGTGFEFTVRERRSVRARTPKARATGTDAN